MVRPENSDEKPPQRRCRPLDSYVMASTAMLAAYRAHVKANPAL